MTAVEWLIEKIMKHDKSFIEFYGAEIEQANKIFEQQIIDAWEDGKDSFSTRSAEQYCNETYGK